MINVAYRITFSSREKLARTNMLRIMIDHRFTISNSNRTSFSDSPLYFDVNVEDETLKNVVPHSVATAFASIVLPVPGGPTMSTPFQGRLIP